MIGWMMWAGIARAADLDLELSVGDAAAELVMADLTDGEPRRVDLVDLGASVELAGRDLRVTLEDARGRVVSALTIEVGSGHLTRVTAPTALGMLHLSARLREVGPGGDTVRCEALRNPTAAALEAALARATGAGGAPQVFAGTATVAEGASSTSGAAMWVCHGQALAR